MKHTSISKFELNLLTMIIENRPTDLIVSEKIGYVVAMMDNFESSNTMLRDGLFKIGEFREVPIFVDRYKDDDDVLLIHKGDESLPNRYRNK